MTEVEMLRERVDKLDKLYLRMLTEKSMLQSKIEAFKEVIAELSQDLAMYSKYDKESMHPDAYGEK